MGIIIRKATSLEVVLLSYSFLVLSLRVSLVPSMVRLGIFATVEYFFVKNIHTCSAHFLGIDGDAGEGRIDLFGQAGVVK